MRLEWWAGEVVALYALQHERRLKILNWPDPWWHWALIFAACAVTLSVVFGIATIVDRVRSPTAARSDGRRTRSKSRRQSV